MRPTVTIKGVELPACLCGCGEVVGGKANYRPGHDARHAGQVARRAADDLDNAAQYLKELPSPALRHKALKQAERLALGRSGPTKARGTPGRVKIGRWDYPARWADDTSNRIERNTKRDGSGAWVPYSGPA